MQAIREALERLEAGLQWMMAASEVKLLQVVTDGDLRQAALEQIASAEHHSLNTTPFVVLEAPAQGEDGWEARTAELREELGAVGQALSGDGVLLPPPLSPGDGLVRFGRELAAAVAVLPEPLAGLTVVLSPVVVEDRRRWVTDLEALLRQRELSKVRLIVVDVDEPISREAAEKLGRSAEVVDARVDRAAARRELDEQLEAMASAPAGTTGPRATGAAGPRVAPPRRRSEPVIDEEAQRRALTEAGVPASLADPTVSQELRVSLLRATQAMSRDDPVLAVRRLKEAIEAHRGAGLEQVAVTLEVMLGSFVLQKGRVEAARKQLFEAREHARAAGLGSLEVQALLAQGLALRLDKRPLEAAAAYEEAAAVGSQNGEPVLAIEAYRLCGQLLITQGRVEPGIQAWKRALVLAEEAPAGVARSSSAPEMARSLAELCRKHGLRAQAATIEAQAERFENAPLTPAEPPAQPLAAREPEALPEATTPAAALPAPPLPPAPAHEDVGKTVELIIDGLFDPLDAELPLDPAEATQRYVPPPLDPAEATQRYVPPPLDPAEATQRYVPPPQDPAETTAVYKEPTLDPAERTQRYTGPLVQRPFQDRKPTLEIDVTCLLDFAAVSAGDEGPRLKAVATRGTLGSQPTVELCVVPSGGAELPSVSSTPRRSTHIPDTLDLAALVLSPEEERAAGLPSVTPPPPSRVGPLLPPWSPPVAPRPPHHDPRPCIEMPVLELPEDLPSKDRGRR